jgi:hypothetical protein
MSEKVPIAMWSGPRNISTAMMRSFGNRTDTAVWDEPLYAYYLDRTGLDHPMREAVITAGETDANTVIENCLAVPDGVTYWFQKHMTMHLLPDVPVDWVERTKSFFLIRRPEAVLASYHDRRANPTIEDVGFRRQAELFDMVTEKTGRRPPVIDSDAVLAAPETVLRRLCDALDMPFDDAMLSWPPGGRPDDGVWAAHWYGSVETSTGFAKPREPRPLPDHLRPLARECDRYYDRLCAHAIPAH